MPARTLTAQVAPAALQLLPSSIAAVSGRPPTRHVRAAELFLHPGDLADGLLGAAVERWRCRGPVIATQPWVVAAAERGEPSASKSGGQSRFGTARAVSDVGPAEMGRPWVLVAVQ